MTATLQPEPASRLSWRQRLITRCAWWLLVAGVAGALWGALFFGPEYTWHGMTGVFTLMAGVVVLLVATAVRQAEASLAAEKQAVARAEANERLFRAIVEDQTEMIVRWKPDGTRTFVNGAYCKVFGITPEQAIGTSFLPLVAEHELEAVRRKIRSLTPESPVATEPHESVTASGAPLWQEWTDRGLFDASGRLVELQSTGRDITERRLAQLALQRAEVMAALGSIVAGVAHEVRGPLFSISACFDALEAELGKEPAYAEFAPLLRSQVTRLSQLTGDLLDYGKAPTLRLAQANVSQLVRTAVRDCGFAAQAQQVSVVEDVPDDLPTLCLDNEKILQVIENLVSNAIQHSPRGAEVHVSARADGRGAEAALLLLVADQGPGVPPGDAARVFEPFFSQRKGGTGLGLSIVQRIVEAHGGRVSVEPGDAGARFTVRLPIDPRTRCR